MKTVSKKPIEEFCTKPTFDEDGVQVSAGINSKGQEVTDPVPVQPPVGYQPPPDLMTMIRTMIHSERFNQAMHQIEAETFEEADDFDVEDDEVEWFDDPTPYEAVFEPPPQSPAVDRPPPAGSPPAAATPEAAAAGVSSPPPPVTNTQQSNT